MTLICDKNIFGTKNYTLKFHPAEKTTQRLDVHKYSDYSVAIIYCTFLPFLVPQTSDNLVTSVHG